MTDSRHRLFLADEPTADVDQLVSRRLREFLASDATVGGQDVKTLAASFTDTSLPTGDVSPRDYVESLFAQIVPHTVRTHNPRFIGHMTSALPSFVDPVGRIMTTLNQNVVKLETSEAFTFLERQVMARIHRLTYGFPVSFYDEHVQKSSSTLAMLVSGGTLGNVSALWCARNAAFPPEGAFRGVAAEGLHAALKHYGYEGAAIIGSSLMHYSLRKAADILGIGDGGIVQIPVDQKSRIDLVALEAALKDLRQRKIRVLAMIGIAGTTETGGIDPLPEMAALAKEYNVHFHVDAAWGGPVLFSKQHRHLLKGIEVADTVTIDGHKQLYLPMGIGLVLLRNPTLAQSIEKSANYIVRADSVDLGRRTLEGSRPALAIFLDAALRIIGADGYEELIDGGIARARYLVEAIRRRSEFELLSDPDLNILVYRYVGKTMSARVAAGKLTVAENERINEVNRKLHAVQWSSGTSFISRTTLENTLHGNAVPIVVLRAVLANPLTTNADIDVVLDEQAAIGARLEQEGA